MGIPHRFPALQVIHRPDEFYLFFHHGLCPFQLRAQSGDGITALSPHIGPYDIFAIEYGYRWYGKENPEEEKDLLYDFLTAIPTVCINTAKLAD